jgi:hypothetical protein
MVIIQFLIPAHWIAKGYLLIHVLHVWNIYQHLPQKLPSHVGNIPAPWSIWVMPSFANPKISLMSTVLGTEEWDSEAEPSFGPAVVPRSAAMLLGLSRISG